ncbi:MAG: hypothetical protein FWF99_05770, partial [Desulfovibrionaceae bacterium]|nr:hypothetical protein [Desulfovibrionaceae bacterium]
MNERQMEYELLVQEALTLLEGTDLGSPAVDFAYRSPFERIRHHSEENNWPPLPEALGSFCAYVKQREEDGTWSAYYACIHKTAVQLLLACSEEGAPFPRYLSESRMKFTPSSAYCELAESAIASEGMMSEDYVGNIRRYMRQFLCFIEKLGKAECSAIDNECIRVFLISCSEGQPKEMTYILGALRKLLAYLEKTGVCHITLDVGLYRPSPVARAPIPPFSRAELRAILKSFDTTTTSGKRNLAIVLIAITTGLRGIDII